MVQCRAWSLPGNQDEHHDDGPSTAESDHQPELGRLELCKRRARIQGTSFGSQPGCMLVTWDVVAVDVTAANGQKGHG